MDPRFIHVYTNADHKFPDSKVINETNMILFVLFVRPSTITLLCLFNVFSKVKLI